jgi:integrase
MHTKRTSWPTDSKGRPVRRVRLEQGVYRSVSGRVEVCYTDSDGRVRFEPQQSPNISAARARRRALNAAKDRGEVVKASPRLKFGEVRRLWLERKVSAKRQNTRDGYARAAAKLPWENRPIDKLAVADVERLVRDLRAAGLSEATVHASVRAAGDIFKFARSKLGWAGSNPVADLDSDDRPKPGSDSVRRLHSKDALPATLRAAKQWARVPLLFIARTAVRESEGLAVQWHELHLDDEAPYVEIAYQLTRPAKGRPAERVALKTDGLASVVPLTRDVVIALKEHRLRSRSSADDDYAFCTSRGTPISQRNLFPRARPCAAPRRRRSRPADLPAGRVLRRRGQGRAAPPRRRPARQARRRRLPHIHGLRHTLATSLVDANVSIEDVSKILRHKDSTTTAKIYVHEIRSAEALRRRAGLLEAMASGMASAGWDAPAQPTAADLAEVADLSQVREAAK